MSSVTDPLRLASGCDQKSLSMTLTMPRVLKAITLPFNNNVYEIAFWLLIIDVLANSKRMSWIGTSPFLRIFFKV